MQRLESQDTMLQQEIATNLVPKDDIPKPESWKHEREPICKILNGDIVFCAPCKKSRQKGCSRAE